MRALYLTLGLVFIGLFLWAAPVMAGNIGVGIGTGKIIIDEPLKPGARYELPVLSVVNTGDVASKYEVTVTYHEQQAEKRPELSWFTFTPSTFSLEPGEAKSVEVALTLPIKTEPTNYFAYLEAHPVLEQDGGNTAINVAAAAKLYFSVEPANVFQGLLFRAKSLYGEYRIPIYVALGAAVLLLAKQQLGRFIDLDIKLKKPTKPEADDK